MPQRTQELSHPVEHSLSRAPQSLGCTLAYREDFRACWSRDPMSNIPDQRDRNWLEFLQVSRWLQWPTAWGQNYLPLDCRVLLSHTRDSCPWNNQIGIHFWKWLEQDVYPRRSKGTVVDRACWQFFPRGHCSQNDKARNRTWCWRSRLMSVGIEMQVLTCPWKGHLGVQKIMGDFY